jgi:hypothetical protein
MSDTELTSRDIGGDPAPSFATDAEIGIAQRLRHELEERYLAIPHPSLQLQPAAVYAASACGAPDVARPPRRPQYGRRASARSCAARNH